MQKDFPNRAVDTDALEQLYGARTVNDCGAPAIMLKPAATP
jgi:hypothetical protein